MQKWIGLILVCLLSSVVAAAETAEFNQIASAEHGRVTTVKTVETLAGEVTTTETVVAEPGNFVGSVVIRGQPGATMAMILANLMQDQTPQKHATIWIIEGGINDVDWFYLTSPPGFWVEYDDELNQVAKYAQICGARLFFQEMTPVVPGVINANPHWAGVNAPAIIPKMIAMEYAVAKKYGVGVIALYDAFLPYWQDWSDASTSVHPNPIGAEHLAQAWADGIKGELTSQTSIYIGGDSIVNLVPPLLVLEKLNALMVPAAITDAWTDYE